MRNGHSFHSALAVLISRAFLGAVIGMSVFCLDAGAVYWTVKSSSDFSLGNFVLNRSTANEDNTVQINKIYDWYNSDWHYRRPFYFNNSNYPLTLTNFQQQISINTAELIDQNKMRPDMADMRFTDSDGKTLIGYYVATGSGTATSVVLKIPEIDSGTIKTVFMYYNNPSTATSISSAKNTFDLYEDWENGIDPLKWSSYGTNGAMYSIDTSTKYAGTSSVRTGKIFSGPSAGEYTYIQTTINLEMQAKCTFYWKVSSEVGYDFMSFMIDANPWTQTGYDNYATPIYPLSSQRFSGEKDWQAWIFIIPKGQHTLTWQYEKDPGDNEGLDCGWVDNIVVGKYTDFSPEVSQGGDEVYTSFYLQGIYQSNVLDTYGEQAQVLYTSWTVVGSTSTSVSIKMRTSDTLFAKDASLPLWVTIYNNSRPPLSLTKGRYMQYEADLSGDGTTTPYLVEVDISYVSPPTKPTGFTGIALSSADIQWSWNDNASGLLEETGYKLYTDTNGVVSTRPPDSTSYIENNLQPNQACTRWVTVYNSSGTNNSDQTTVYTLAQQPKNRSEVYSFVEGVGPTYTAIPTGTDIFSSTFTFTSDISTTTVEYYRVAFTTNPNHTADANDTFWIPYVTIENNPDTGDQIFRKPQILKNALFNATSWYFSATSYNHINSPSGVTVLGPYSFQGCPSGITNLTARPSTSVEGGIVLTWTAPSADGSRGVDLAGGRYIVKARNTYLIQSDAQFDLSDNTTFIISTSAVAGQKQSFTINGLTPGLQLGFAIKSLDSDGNISQLSSNIITSTTTADTRTYSSSITKIIFVTSSVTARVGQGTPNMTIETRDANDHPLKVQNDVTINLVSTSSKGTFGQNGSWGLTSVTIRAGQSQAVFQYKDNNDNTNGQPRITASESPSKGWAPAVQTESILPARAVRFMMDYAPSSGGSGNIGTDQTVTIRANDGYNDPNVSSDYLGDIAITCNVPGVTLTPSTHSFITSDTGQTTFTIGNKGDTSIAGNSVFTVSEVVSQNYTGVHNGMLIGDGGLIKSRDDQGRWFTQRYSTGSANGLYGLASPDDINIWACGVDGKGVVSSNSGDSWSGFDTGIGAGNTLYAIYFVNVSTGWAVGAGGKIVKTFDGGATWNSETSPVAQKLRSVYFLNVSTGWAAGDAGTLIKTYDSGQTWQSVGLGTGNLNSIFFSDNSTGFVAGDGGKIYKTINEGSSWTQQTTPLNSDLYSIDFYNSSLGFAAGAYSTILRTQNGGGTWQIVTATQSAGPVFYGISFVGTNSNYLTAVGSSGNILSTTDQGSSWSTSSMTGISNPFTWNGLVVTGSSLQSSMFVQGKINQGIRVGLQCTSSGGTSTLDMIRVMKSSSSTCDDTDITSIVVARDNDGNGVYDPNVDTKLGEDRLSSGVADISISRTITNGTEWIFIMPNVALKAGALGKTFGMTLTFTPAEDRFINVASGLQFANNNLPITLSPLQIVPSTCTVVASILDESPAQVQQGARDILISSMSMTTDRGNTPWQQLIVKRIGVNNADSDIERIKLYEGPTPIFTDATLISSTTFGAVRAGQAVINISPNQTLYYTTTNYYFLTVDISPTAVYYTSSSEAYFNLLFDMTTSYFTLDGGGSNGIAASTPTFKTQNIRVSQAFNTLCVVPVPGVDFLVDQSKIAASQTLDLYVQQNGGRVDITKIHVAELGTASDSDVDSVRLYRDSNGDGILDPSVDTLLGSGKLSSGEGDIVLSAPEIINRPITSFATYFVAALISKRATVGNTVKLRMGAAGITLAGVNTVSPSNFPINTPAATIQNYRDTVNVTLTSLAPKEARVDETGIAMSRIKLCAYCSAVFTQLTLEFNGTGIYTNVNAVKLYLDADGDDTFSPADTLLSSGTYGSNGKATLVLSSPITVYDSSSTVFVVYDLDPNSTPQNTIGMGVTDTSLVFPSETGAYRFGYYQTAPVRLLNKETPSIPKLALNIGFPSGKMMNGETVYFSNQASQLTFNWQSQALNGVAQAKYALCSYDVYSTTDTPNITSWFTTAVTDAQMRGMNLKHNTMYYLWVKAVSTDGYERVTSAPILIDLVPPDKPVKLTDTSPKAKSAVALKASNSPLSSYWVSWDPVVDPIAGVAYYELQERCDTSPVWHTVSTTTVNEYFVTKDTATDAGKFFYYRARALNYAGSWSDYSDSSAAAYLSLPPDFVKDLASYPNPFDSRKQKATITFILNQDATVIFKVFDLFGRLVKGWQSSGSAGENRVYWDGCDDGGQKVAAGMYILYVEIQGSDQTVKKRYKIGVIH